MSNEQNLHTRSCLLGREGAGRAGNCGFRDVHPERGHRDLAIYSAIKPAFVGGLASRTTSRCSYLAARHGTACGSGILKTSSAACLVLSP